MNFAKQYYFLNNINVTINKFVGSKSFKCELTRKCSYKKPNDEHYFNFNEIPGPRSYPVVGTLYKYLPLIGEYSAEALHENASLNYRRYGSLVREALLPGTSILHIFNPHDVEILFRNEGRMPERRSHLAMLNHRLSKPASFNTGGLLATNGPEWWRLRSTFQKNFSGPQSVKIHVEATDFIVKKFVQWINCKLPDIDDFLPLLNRLNLEVIGLIAFEEEFNSFSPEEQISNSRSSKCILSAFESNSGIMKLDQGFLWRLFKTPLYYKLEKSQDYLEKVSKEILLKKISFYESSLDNKRLTNSLLESFLMQPNLDLKDVIGMMVDILMAAIDTTSYSTSFALYHISKNQKNQEKLFEEAVNLLPDQDSPLTAYTLSKAIYTRSCIKESLRLNPVSVGVGRVLLKDIVLRGYLIRKGTVVVTQNMIASRLPQYARDPLQFKPERWLRESDDYEPIHPFLSLPFGFGPRSCIARRLAEQNMCITLLRLVRRYKMNWGGGKLGVRTLLINKPNQPIHLHFTERKV